MLQTAQGYEGQSGAGGPFRLVRADDTCHKYETAEGFVTVIRATMGGWQEAKDHILLAPYGFRFAVL